MDDVAQRQWMDPAPVQPSQELIDLVNGSRLAAELLVHGAASPIQPQRVLSSSPTSTSLPLRPTFPGWKLRLTAS